MTDNNTTSDAIDIAFSQLEQPIDGREIGPAWDFRRGAEWMATQPLCLGCRRPFASPDHDARCSACVESGTGPEACAQAPRWIACSERMPERRAKVWFFTGSVRRGFYDSEFYTHGGFCWAMPHVSHWMLDAGQPEPPTERKAER